MLGGILRSTISTTVELRSIPHAELSQQEGNASQSGLGEKGEERRGGRLLIFCLGRLTCMRG